MRRRGLNTDDFFQLVFKQDQYNIYDQTISSRYANKKPNTRSLMLDIPRGIIWSYEIHVLGVLRIFEDVKYLVIPYEHELLSQYNQSVTTNKHREDMIYHARKAGWKIKYFMPDLSQIYEAGIQEPQFYNALTMKESYFSVVNAEINFHNVDNIIDLYNFLYNINQSFQYDFFDHVVPELRIGFENTKYDNPPNATLKITSRTDDKNYISKTLNMDSYKSGIIVKKFFV